MRHSEIVRSLLLVLPLIALGSTGCAADSQSGKESLQSTRQPLTNGDAGFVWASLPTGSYDADSFGTFNSAGGTNHVTWLDTGYYRVDVPGIGSVTGGDVQVTAYDWGGNLRCKVWGWGSAGSTLQVYVSCYTPSGAPINTGFMMNYLRRADTPGAEGAYLWAYDATSASYTASSEYQWNSTGGDITVTHTPGTGTYYVSPAGQDLGGGTVEVTAYGGSNSYCKVGSWGGDSIAVLCFDGSTGNPVESQFDLVFSTKSPNNIPSFTYAWAEQPTTRTYNPDPAYEHGEIGCGCPGNVPEPNATITRTGVGQYAITFPGMASIVQNPSNVKLTGYGWGSDTCEINEWFQGRDDGYANIQCFAADGTPVDADFTITYSSFAYAIG
jgi:hypothetical protein